MIDARYGILLSPTITEEGWTGDVEVNIAFTESPDLDEEDNDMLFHILQMMASSLELMETDVSFATKLQKIVTKRVDYLADKYGDKDELTEVLTEVEHGDDNVIHLKFVKTEGTA